MNTQTTPVRACRFGTGVLLLAGLCLFLKLQPDCRADSIYNYTVNTSAISGQNGYLAFDLIGGDASSANNTATAGNFSTDGSLLGSSIVILTDTGFFNEEQRAITFGSFLNFTLQLTENNVPAGLDEFSFFLLDSTGFQSLVITTDPTGADALFAVDIDGSHGGLPSVFEGSLTPSTASIPDGGGTFSLLLLSLGTAGLVGLARKFPARPPQV